MQLALPSLCHTENRVRFQIPTLNTRLFRQEQQDGDDRFTTWPEDRLRHLNADEIEMRRSFLQQTYYAYWHLAPPVNARARRLRISPEYGIRKT